MKVILNPDKKVVEMLKEGLKRKDGYCPCKLERIPENKCMCQEFRNQIKDKDKVSSDLARILGVTKEEMDKHVKKVTSIERVHPEGRRLDYETADKINALNLPGVYLVKECLRHYPYNNNLSHVLGYVGIDNQGMYGA